MSILALLLLSVALILFTFDRDTVKIPDFLFFLSLFGGFVYLAEPAFARHLDVPLRWWSWFGISCFVLFIVFRLAYWVRGRRSPVR
jgi:hypothetical protein